MPIQLTDPQEPDDIARRAGKDLYGTPVGMLRRVELYRLGNAWGMNFPVGATKDYMLPFFQRLEAQGKNPLRPPQGDLDTVVKTRECEFNGENHSETPPPEEVEEAPVPADTIKPAEKTEFEAKLETLHHFKLKQMCKARGIFHRRDERKSDLIAKIMAAVNSGVPME